MANASLTAVRAGVQDAARSLQQSVRNAPSAARELAHNPRSIVKGAPLAPLLVLYGHTLLDSVDRGGFNVILPNIQREFGLSTDEITGVAAAAILVSLILGVPAAYLSDRGSRRVWWLASGALMAAVFSTLTGIAVTVGLFVVARAGFGLGIRLNDPVQGSLLSDYYAVDTRPTTFAGRQGMDNLGQLLGPLFFGLTTAVFGWRAAVLSIAVPSVVLFIFSMRLPEPVRGAPERAAMGADESAVITEEPSAGFWESIVILHRIPSLRRIFFAIPFIIGGVLGISVLFPLFQEEVFGLTAAERGLFGAFTNIAGIVGLVVGVPISKRYLVSGRPEGMLDLLGAGGLIATLALAAMALAPNLVVMAAGGLLFFFVAALFLPSIATLTAMIVPARVRGMGFAMMGCWAVPGLVMLPVAGGVGDAYGLRWGMIVGLPLLTAGAMILASGKRELRADIERAYQQAMASITGQPSSDPSPAEPPPIPAG